MWPQQRQLAVLFTVAICWTSGTHAADAGGKRVSSQSNIRVVSVTEDTAGNFVLLNTQKRQQLPCPQIHYLPADNGRAIMTVDFANTILCAPPSNIRLHGPALTRMHVGQLQASPPIVRIAIESDSAKAFKHIDLRSVPGSLTLRLPAPQRAYAQPAPHTPSHVFAAPVHSSVAPVRSAPPIASLHQSSVDPVPAPPFKPLVQGTTVAPPLAPNLAVRTPVIHSPDPNLPALRGPIAMSEEDLQATVTDARYTRLPDKTGLKDGFKHWLGIGSKPKAMNAAAPSVAPGMVPDPVMPPVATAPKELYGPFQARELYGPPAPRQLFGPPSPKELFGPPAPKTARTPAPAPEAGAVQIAVGGSDPITVRVKAPQGAEFKTFRLHAPERLVIDLDGADPSKAPSVPELSENPWLKSIRVGAPEGAEHTTRVVLDLAGTDVADDENSDEKEHAIAIVLRHGNVIEAPTVARRDIRKCTIVLDAGHGGTDPGAQRGDVQEKELTMCIVERLRKALQAAGIRVCMTRSDDTFVSLEDRVRITNNLQPDAFVSVHINSMQTNNDTHGIETYYQTEKSKPLADIIHAAIVKELGAPDRSVRKARFYVINHTPVPAILCEVGFISNKDERDKLISSDYQEHIAGAIASGVMLYLSETRDVASNGTISAVPPSTSQQSFTQNLHSKTIAEAPSKLSEISTSRGAHEKNADETAKINASSQPLQFNKKHLAGTRSL